MADGIPGCIKVLAILTRCGGVSDSKEEAHSRVRTDELTPRLYHPVVTVAKAPRSSFATVSESYFSPPALTGQSNHTTIWAGSLTSDPSASLTRLTNVVIDPGTVIGTYGKILGVSLRCVYP